jgi:hypothetical protein
MKRIHPKDFEAYCNSSFNRNSNGSVKIIDIFKTRRDGIDLFEFAKNGEKFIIDSKVPRRFK